MKLTNIKVTNDSGEEATLTRAEYIKHIIKTQEVKTFVAEGAEVEPDALVGHILKSFEDGKAVDEAVSDGLPALVNLIEADYKASSETKEDKAAKAAAEKEKKEQAKKEEEAKKQEEAKLVLAGQTEIASAFSKGADLAAEEFKSELEGLRVGLPDGVSITGSGSGYGIALAEGATKETVGLALGYFQGKSNNSQFIANQLQFFIGDLISTTINKGIFTSAKEAGKFISDYIAQSQNKVYEVASLDQYKRMAERTPIELRNPKVDQTAYLAIASMKTPKKGEINSKETDDQFKDRVGKFEEDRRGLQERLASGEITKRKEILEPVTETLIKHGLKEKPSDEPQILVGQELLKFFHASLAIDKLASVHKQDLIIYKEGDKTHGVSIEEMQEMRDEAYGNLINIFYTNKKLGLEPADYFRGTVDKTTEVEVGKGQDGKPIKEPKTTAVEVFPAPFFAIPEPAAAEAESEAASEDAPAADSKKKAK